MSSTKYGATAGGEVASRTRVVCGVAGDIHQGLIPGTVWEVAAGVWPGYIS